MAKYHYKAFGESGLLVTGVIIEDDIELAKESLITKEYQIISIQQKKTIEDLQIKRLLNEETLASFCGEIGTILDSGVSILRGLEILYEQSEKKSYKQVVGSLLSSVKKGMNLSVAMERARVFPSLLTDMVHSGEISSHLVDILYSMEDFYQREANIKNKVKSASIYPVILVLVSFGMISFFNFFVFAEMKTLFEDMDDLPALTRGLVGILDYVNGNPIIVLGGLLGLIFLTFALSKLEAIKLLFDKVVLRLPLIGPVRKNIIAARIASSMAIFIKSAVPLTKVLQVVEAIASNKFIGGRVSMAKEEIIRGVNISDAFANTGVFDNMMIQLIRIGEETGKLEEMLFKLAAIYEKKSNQGIEQLVAMVEPMFTLIIGLIVGVIIVAMALPIFNMSSMLGG